MAEYPGSAGLKLDPTESSELDISGFDHLSD
jgi:hypothetical protein